MCVWQDKMAWYAGGVTAGMVMIAVLPEIVHPWWQAAAFGLTALIFSTWAS